MLELTGIQQYYGQSHILREVSLTVPAGACTCLMGRNGVGKTTLLKVIMGLLPARAGQVVFAGQDLTRADTRERARLGIGYVPQGREIFPRLTVEENLRVSLGIRRAKALPERIFELFPVLRDMLHRRGGDLSGGQQQQLAIARALVLEPKLLILDEPCEGIQPNIVRDIGDVLTRLRQESGLAVLLVEQKLPFARRVADRFFLLERGSVVADGGIDELSEELVQRHLVV
ncbi:urea ABC transporter ATP-binding subunit UrtE [Immundisolibacter sp.]|uniref:urea ABC transporter ATP-binding subunit UrtE n=1 Tax=Immundisolibacter sp. TaxID=1934948 RepID=UPI000EDB98AC|nr:urea ABC transporter ATP-binding subunit UrtE [Gammaproteobacteria bacterium]